MNKKFLSILIAVIMICSFFSGCAFIESILPDDDSAPAVEKVQIKIDSNSSPTLNEGDTYKLLFSCDEEVTISCNGKFNYKTNIFTADKAGEFEIKLSAGEGDAYNEVSVKVTVIAKGDKTELIQLINSASVYIESDYYNYSTLVDELQICNALIARENVTQTEIDNAVSSLRNVCNNLNPVAFGNKKAEVKETFVRYNGNYYYKNYYTNFTDVADGINKVNSDYSIKLFSVYNGKIQNELKKLIGIDGKELAVMNFERGTLMAEKVFDSYYTERPVLGNIVYDVLDENGNHIKNTGTGNKETDFWSLTSLFALMVRLDTVTGKSYKEQVDKVIDAMAYHRGTRSDNNAGENGAAREFKVYGVHRSNVKDHMDVVGYLGRESVFDDQIWAAQEFLNAYNLYKEKSYLESAVELTEYIYLVGRCEIGGIYWGQGYTTRHACSSAPFVKLAAMLAEATGQSKYLDWAKDVYEWTYNTLRDPSDNLYYDLIGTRFKIESKYPDSTAEWQNPKYIEGNEILGNGGIDAKKYSYNSGSMVSAGVALYKATGDKKYLTQAKATAYSCRSYFGKTNVEEGFTVYPGSDGGTTYSWFDLILFKGYFDLFEVDKSAGELLDDVQKVYDHDYANYFKDGFMPTTGLIGWTTGRNSYGYRVLMDHVTNADVLLLLGQYKELQ